jgi:hypothetical protein
MSQQVRFDKWQPAALKLAHGSPLADAAAASGVDVRTLYRWRKKPAFAAAVTRYRDEMAAEAVGRMSAALGKAVDTLVALLDAPEPFVRLRAATALLESCAKWRGDVEMAARVRELEQQVNT